MSNPTLTQASHLLDGARLPASSFVPTNQRVTSGNLPLSVQTDVPTFSGTTVTGTWIVVGSRVTAGGIGVINSSSVGVGYSAAPSPTGPLQISLGNQHVTIKF